MLTAVHTYPKGSFRKARATSAVTAGPMRLMVTQSPSGSRNSPMYQVVMEQAPQHPRMNSRRRLLRCPKIGDILALFISTMVRPNEIALRTRHTSSNGTLPPAWMQHVVGLTAQLQKLYCTEAAAALWMSCWAYSFTMLADVTALHWWHHSAAFINTRA